MLISLIVTRLLRPSKVRREEVRDRFGLLRARVLEAETILRSAPRATNSGRVLQAVAHAFG